MRTEVSNEEAERQVRDAQGARVISVVRSVAGWRFVDEELVLQPAENRLDAYMYWEERHRSGVYETADIAWADALKSSEWLTEATSDRARVMVLLRAVISRSMSIEVFCGAFETAYNFEISKGQLPQAQEEALAALFEMVVRYSPSEEERASIGYVGEDEVMRAVSVARTALEADR